MSLSDWQLQTGGLVIGDGTAYRLTALDHEKPEASLGDQRLPGRDGLAFGRDTLSGTVVTIEADIIGSDAEAAFTMLATWRAAWQADDVRATPGAVTALSYRLPGREGVVFGRPRRFTPATLENAILGIIPVTCDFQCADHRWYGATEQVITLSTMPDTTGGITWDITWDLMWAGTASAGDQVNNTGNADTYGVVTFRGPVTNPGVSWAGRTISLGTTITAGQAVTLDCRPWVNTATYDNGGSVAGLLRGNRLSEMTLPPGLTEVLFTGTDDTGTAQCEIRWRSASSAP